MIFSYVRITEPKGKKIIDFDGETFEDCIAYLGTQGINDSDVRGGFDRETTSITKRSDSKRDGSDIRVVNLTFNKPVGTSAGQVNPSKAIWVRNGKASELYFTLDSYTDDTVDISFSNKLFTAITGQFPSVNTNIGECTLSPIDSNSVRLHTTRVGTDKQTVSIMIKGYI